MKRRLITLVLMGSLLPLFAACQQNPTDTPGGQQGENQEESGTNMEESGNKKDSGNKEESGTNMEDQQSEESQ